tara:strand:+ start:147 stop:317 length:171 start_codon:yes stop_codon:yes gene_type:complete
MSEKNIKQFVEGYKKLCNELGVYLVFELEEYWLEDSGEQLDTDEAVQRLEEILYDK